MSRQITNPTFPTVSLTDEVAIISLLVQSVATSACSSIGMIEENNIPALAVYKVQFKNLSNPSVWFVTKSLPKIATPKLRKV
jgi:hypothetical protein